MRKKKEEDKSIVPEIMASGKSFTDPQGSWTGKPTDEDWPIPVQDVDDL